MELPSKLLEKIYFNTRPYMEEQISVVMVKIVHEKHLSQRLQANFKQFKLAVAFLTGYSGIFNVTNEINKFFFEKSIFDTDDFIQKKYQRVLTKLKVRIFK